MAVSLLEALRPLVRPDDWDGLCTTVVMPKLAQVGRYQSGVGCCCWGCMQYLPLWLSLHFNIDQHTPPPIFLGPCLPTSTPPPPHTHTHTNPKHAPPAPPLHPSTSPTQAVQEWNPREDTVPINAWILPWLPILGQQLTAAFPEIRRKLAQVGVGGAGGGVYTRPSTRLRLSSCVWWAGCKEMTTCTPFDTHTHTQYSIQKHKLFVQNTPRKTQALVDWHPSDASAHVILQPWATVRNACLVVCLVVLFCLTPPTQLPPSPPHTDTPPPEPTSHLSPPPPPPPPTHTHTHHHQPFTSPPPPPHPPFFSSRCSTPAASRRSSSSLSSPSSPRPSGGSPSCRATR